MVAREGESEHNFEIPAGVLSLAPLVGRIFRNPEARKRVARCGVPPWLRVVRTHSRWGYYPPESLVLLNKMRSEHGLPAVNPTFDMAWRAVDASLLFGGEVKPNKAHPAEGVLKESAASLDVFEVLILHSEKSRVRSGIRLLGRMPREWACSHRQKVEDLLRYWVHQPRIDVYPQDIERARIREAIVYAVKWLGCSFHSVLSWEEPDPYVKSYRSVVLDPKKRSQV